MNCSFDIQRLHQFYTSNSNISNVTVLDSQTHPLTLFLTRQESQLIFSSTLMLVTKCSFSFYIILKSTIRNTIFQYATQFFSSQPFMPSQFNFSACYLSYCVFLVAFLPAMDRVVASDRDSRSGQRQTIQPIFSMRSLAIPRSLLVVTQSLPSLPSSIH